MTTPREPSMEDILASIKRVIAEEKEIRSGTVPAQPEAVTPFADDPDGEETDDAPAADLGPVVHADPFGAEQDDVLELGPAMEAVDPVMPTPEPGQAAEDRVAPPPPPPRAPLAQPVAPAQPLLDESLAAGSRQRLAELQDLAASPPPRPSTGNPFEDLVRDMLRPMLKAWLDDHLPDIVDAHVRREVSRITGRDL